MLVYWNLRSQTCTWTWNAGQPFRQPNLQRSYQSSRTSPQIRIRPHNQLPKWFRIWRTSHLQTRTVIFQNKNPDKNSHHSRQLNPVHRSMIRLRRRMYLSNEPLHRLVESFRLHHRHLMILQPYIQRESKGAANSSNGFTAQHRQPHLHLLFLSPADD